jgi:hypothetical protein
VKGKKRWKSNQGVRCMEVIKVKELVEVFEELEKRYGPKWYEHVHVDVNTDIDGTIRAVVTPNLQSF